MQAFQSFMFTLLFPLLLTVAADEDDVTLFSASSTITFVNFRSVPPEVERAPFPVPVWTRILGSTQFGSRAKGNSGGNLAHTVAVTLRLKRVLKLTEVT